MADGTGKRIVVFLPNPVGDVVMATPALRALREHYGGGHIAHVGRRIALEVLSPNAWADETILDHSRLAPKLANSLWLARRLRSGRFDTAVLLPNSFRAAALARAGGLKRLVGYSRDARGWLLTDKRPPPRDEEGRLVPVSAVDYYLELARLAGASAEGRLSRKMALDVGEADQAAADDELRRASAGSGPVVMLNPGSAFGPSKIWDPGRFAAVADALMERCGARIIINAAPSEKAVAAEVERAMGRRPAVSFARRDNRLGLLKGLLRRCALLITNDTGARHIAAALGANLVTIFGSTAPAWARIDCDSERIIRVDVSCSPCQRRICRQPAGPDYHQCMSRITPETVIDAAMEILGRRAAAVEAAI